MYHNNALPTLGRDVILHHYDIIMITSLFCTIISDKASIATI
jgi:hypothetical protein